MTSEHDNLGELSPDAVQDLAQQLLGKRRAPAVNRISARAAGTEVPLSGPQQAMWLEEQLGNTGGTYNELSALRIRGPLNVAALRGSLDAVVARHESLRTHVVLGAGESGIQVVDPDLRCELVEVDLTDIASERQAAEVERLCRQEQERPFDLSTGPLFRAALLKLSAAEHVLLWTVHHIVWDGWSVAVFIGDLITSYAAVRESRVVPAAANGELQFGDFAVWQAAALARPVGQEHFAYWKRKLAAPQRLQLPLDYPRPARRSYRGAAHPFALPAALSSGLEQLAQSVGATVFMTLLAAYQLLLARLSGQRDILVASPVAGRNHAQTERMIGMFVTTLALRVEITEGSSFRELLQQVKQSTLEAFTHQESGIQGVMRELQMERDLSQSVLAQASFTLYGASPTRYDMAGLSVEPLSPGTTFAKTDLSLYISESPGAYAGRFEYATDLFAPKTVAGIATRFERLLAQLVANPDLDVDAVDITLPAPAPHACGRYSLSAAQRSASLELQRSVDPLPYLHHAECVEIAGQFDATLLGRAIQHVATWASVLRLRFSSDERAGMEQDLGEPRPIDISQIDLSNSSDPHKDVQTWITAARGTHIEVLTQVPFRFALIRLPAERLHWYSFYNCLLVDARAARLLTQQIAATYAALASGVEPPAASDAAAYVQYLHADAEYRHSLASAADRKYWLAHSNNGTPVSLSVRPNGSVGAKPLHAEARVEVLAAQRLREQAARIGIDLEALLTSATALYLYKVTGTERLSIGIPVAPCAELIANCDDVLPLDFIIDAQDTLADFAVATAREMALVARHGRFRYAKVRQLWRSGNSEPRLYNIAVQVHQECVPLQFGASYSQLPRYADDLTIRLSVSASGALRIALDGNPRLYELWELQGHAQGLARFVELLTSGATDGACTLESLSLLGAAERTQLLTEFNATRADYDRTLLAHQLFEAQVARDPHAVAAVGVEGSLSYGELNARANQLARYLRERGVGPDIKVAMCITRSFAMLTGLLGILKAGGAYVPLEPSYPRERLEHMLADAAPLLVLTEQRLRPLLPDCAVDMLCLDSDWDYIDGYASANLAAPELVTTAGDLAYVIYTSGSTGKPKGVAVEHRSLVNFLAWRCALVVSREVCIQKGPLSFDMSIGEVLLPLSTGARLVIAEPNRQQDAEYLAELIHEHGVTRIGFVPSMLRAMLPFWSTKCRSITRVVSGAEVLNDELLAAIHTFGAPDQEVTNWYGPTEATIAITAFVCERGQAGNNVPIGKPINNVACYVLDRHGNLAPVGVPGELYVGGECLARGYLNLPEETAQRFIANPVRDAEVAARVYRTGDLVRWLPDGNLEFLGRIDHQVKIRGFRIELAEIEAQLARHPKVKEAVVLAREDVPGDKRLVAYLTTRGAQEPTSQELAADLRSKLPEYMVPSICVVLERMPFDPNGKLDRNALPAPEGARSRDDYVAPQGEIETTIAEIWAELLQVDRVGRRDNFFELGGHSLLAVRIARRISQALDIELPMQLLFETRSLEELGKEVEAIRWVTQSAAAAHVAVDQERERITL